MLGAIIASLVALFLVMLGGVFTLFLYIQNQHIETRGKILEKISNPSTYFAHTENVQKEEKRPDNTLQGVKDVVK